MQPVERIYAYLNFDPVTGAEAVAAVVTPLGAMPMSFTSADVAERMRPVAVGVAKLTGRDVVLAEFTRTRNIETVRGDDT